MLKLSSLLQKAAENTASNMLRQGLDESHIPNMLSFLVSTKDNCPKGYTKAGIVKTQGKIFHVFQLF